MPENGYGPEQRNTLQPCEKRPAHPFLTYASAALIAEAVSYPFTTIWTVQHKGDLNGNTLKFNQACAQIRTNASIRNGFGFYSGFFLSQMAALPGGMAYLTGKGEIENSHGNNVAGHALRGFVPQALFAAISTPIDRLVMLQQAAKNTANPTQFDRLSISHKAKHIFKTEGIRGFYRGCIPSICSYALADFFGYILRDLIRNLFSQQHQESEIFKLATTMVCFGTVAILTTPLDVVATRLKVKQDSPHAKLNLFYQAKAEAMALYRTAGRRGFWVGTTASVLYHALWSSSIYTQESNMEKTKTLRY